MIKPRALERGDRLAIVAPASPFSRDEFDRGVGELRRLGFAPVFDESVFAREGFLAGSAAVRAAAIRSAWRDPSIAGLVAVRGGYGSMETLPLLDREEMRRTPKAFVGYSDLTAVLAFLTLYCGIVAFHGPMLDGRLARGSEGYDEATFLGALTSAAALGELTAPGLQTTRAGEARGVLVGGTITQLVASLGTPFAFDPPAGSVLFLEEIGERPYRLHRMVTQLAQAGVLARASAIVVGELTGCDEPSGDPHQDAGLTGRAVMENLFRDFPGPVLMGFPSGHTIGPSLTLPLGVACRVVGTGRPALVIEEGAVA
jgi:muramoyltetrapeptide carboxypeptidase